MNGDLAKTILVVEDDVDILKTLEVFFTSEGYKTLLAENGQVALDLIKKHGLPQLILLDMKMPVMNGWQFAKEFVQRHDHQAPILVMTAAADAAQRAKEIGAAGWIAKPCLLDDLLASIKKYSWDRSHLH